MLTGNLLLATFRKGKIYPQKLQPNEANLAIAESLIDLFQTMIGVKRQEIEEEIRLFGLDDLNPKIPAGLGKLLLGRCTFSRLEENIDPITLRKTVFDIAADYWQNTSSEDLTLNDHRKALFKTVPNTKEAYFYQPEQWLFADIGSNQILMDFVPPKADQLIHEYNLSQVQGYLLNTVNLRLTVSRKQDSAFRQVMQKLKFFRLMYEVQKFSSSEIVLEIDGPSSVLENARTYGVEIANFFPAILLLETNWKLEALVKVSGRPRNFIFEVTEKNPYQTSNTTQGVWVHQKIQEVVERFNKKYPKEYTATLQNEIIPLANNRFLLPDFQVKSEEKKWNIELIRYFSKSRVIELQQKIDKAPENYIFALKGKRTTLQEWFDIESPKLLIFQNDLTAPAIRKKLL